MYTQTESAKTRGPRTEKKEPHCYEILPIRNETENKSIVSTNAHSATTTTTNPTSHGQKAKQQPYVDGEGLKESGTTRSLSHSPKFCETRKSGRWFGGLLGGLEVFWVVVGDGGSLE